MLGDMESKKFKVLAIDGGGTRGILPAKFLAQLEKDLQEKGMPGRIRDHVDLLCGTSTGGIIALGLAQGIPAQELLDLYKKEAKTIFKYRPSLFLRAHYHNGHLEALLKKRFATSDGKDIRMKDLPARVCVPAYDLLNATPRVFKATDHPLLTNDRHIPVYQVAMATAAAPTYFKPYSSAYTDTRDGSEQQFLLRVDGGVFANNPALIGFIEAHRGLGIPLDQIRVLSIGTGQSTFCESGKAGLRGLMPKWWGVPYWMKKKRLIDLFMQAQAQATHYTMQILSGGVGEQKKEVFTYARVSIELGSQLKLPLDAKQPNDLKALEELGFRLYQNHGKSTIDQFFDGRSFANYTPPR